MKGDSTLIGMTDDLNPSTPNDSLGGIVRDAGEQAATQGVDMSDFFKGAWEWAVEKIGSVFEGWTGEDWGNVGGIGVLLVATLLVVFFSTGKR